MTRRLYNEKEIAAILRDAADDEGAEGGRSDIGLSIDELAQIGADSGLSPAAIRRAAARFDARSDAPEKPGSIWGGPVAHEESFVIDRELTPAEWERLVPDIRRAFNIPGEVAVRPSAFEWSHKSALDSYTAHVSAVVEDGRTRIRMAASDPPVPVPYFMPTFLIAMMGLPALLTVTDLGPWSILVWAMLVGLGFMGSRAGVQAHARRNRKKVQGLARDLHEALERDAAPAAAVSGETDIEPGPRTDLFDGMPDASEDRVDARRSRTT